MPDSQWTCNGCGAGEHEIDTIDERYSLGIYAGRWCDPCWDQSGYRKEGPEEFDPMDAGESYEPLD